MRQSIEDSFSGDCGLSLRPIKGVPKRGSSIEQPDLSYQTPNKGDDKFPKRRYLQRRKNIDLYYDKIMKKRDLQ